MIPSLSMDNKRLAGSGQAMPSSIPASIKGWDAISSLADMPPDHAVVLDNFIPRPGYVEIRRGSKQWATVPGVSFSVSTIMGYNAPNSTNSKLFAMGAGSTASIYDITATGTGVLTSATGFTAATAYFVNFTNVSLNTYLFVCTGQDTPVSYNGTIWATAGITTINADGSTASVTAGNMVQPAVWKNRLWFTFANSTQVAYMGQGAITGTATTFQLGSLMTKGGYIQAIATWTIDTKTWVDEYIAFISSRGEVFVYQGTDPTTANTFALVGVYQIGNPIGGPRCFLKISGNLWIITQDGVIPMTEMIMSTVDRLAAPRVAITANIMSAINTAVASFGSYFGWQLISYPKGTLVIMNAPADAIGVTFYQYVMNTITGAWCRFTGLQAECWEVFNGTAYFGAAQYVYQWDIDSGDHIGTVGGTAGNTINGVMQTAFNYFDTRGFKKRFTAVRPIITLSENRTAYINYTVGILTDFVSSTPTLSTPAIGPINGNTSAYWTNVDGVGQSASIQVNINTNAIGVNAGITAQINGWDITMEKGLGFY